MFNFLKKRIHTGGLLDTRIEDEKQKDWLHEELASGEGEVVWEEKSQYKEYYPYDQSSSLSCVAGGATITEEHFEKRHGRKFVGSRKDVYIRRFNKPQGGMMMHDLFNIYMQGMASEEQVPSQRLGETAMNSEYPLTSGIQQTRAKQKLKNWVSIKNFTDTEELARIVDHTPVVVFWYFADGHRGYDEWWKTFPVTKYNVSLYGSETARHQAALVDRTLIGDKKYFVVQDTAGVGTGIGGHRNLRFVSEEFIKARAYAAGYGIDDLVYEEGAIKPKFSGTRTLKVGMTGKDVIELQDILKFYGLFPKTQTSTGYFGGITRAAVIKLQEKFASEILHPVGLTKGTGIVGPSTLAWLKKHHG